MRGHTDFEVWAKRTATASGLDASKPFPFLVQGRAKEARYHIVNTPNDGTPSTRERHDKTKWHDTLKDREVEMLGFYSEKHAGVFTHHTSFVHVHVRTKDNATMGHLDDLRLGEEMAIYFPAL